jgi:hypothetical protein
MKRQGHENVEFFHGTEVERTPAYGKFTLFVVGVQPIDAIALNIHYAKHIFFGANHSFNPAANDYNEWKAWDSMITFFLEKGYLCTLDIPITAVEEFNDSSLCEYNNFIPQIRVSIPYTKLWNYNTMLKVDDKDFDSTNPGVWCHSLHSLMTRESFTPWTDYTKDQPV